MNGVYWGACALAVMRADDALDRAALIDFVLSCWDAESGTCTRCDAMNGTDTGGFAPYPAHDAHVLSTLSAIQVLALRDALDALGGRRERIIQCAYTT